MGVELRMFNTSCTRHHFHHQQHHCHHNLYHHTTDSDNDNNNNSKTINPKNTRQKWWNFQTQSKRWCVIVKSITQTDRHTQTPKVSYGNRLYFVHIASKCNIFPPLNRVRQKFAATLTVYPETRSQCFKIDGRQKPQQEQQHAVATAVARQLLYWIRMAEGCSITTIFWSTFADATPLYGL